MEVSRFVGEGRGAYPSAIPHRRKSRERFGSQNLSIRP